MKNVFLLMIAVVIMAACSQKNTVEEPFDKWNGYGKYLKYGDVYVPIIAAQHDTVGMMRYGLTDQYDPDNGYFYVVYTLDPGYQMTESHVYVGLKADMPMSKIKKGTTETSNPKIGNFPYSETYSTPVSYDSIFINCLDLPPVNPGFVVASHCVVTATGYNETAWGWGDSKFTDKGWGMYYTYAYEVPTNKFTILYGTAYVDDTLKLFHIDVTNGGTPVEILKEFVGNNLGRFDGAAYDEETDMFFFANYSTGELYVNYLKDENADSYSAGTLLGTAASGTFFEGNYYYINEDENTINKVIFTSDFYIANEIVLDTIPSAVLVNDIAMDPTGETIYMLGEVNGGGKQLISWDVSDETFFSIDISVNSGAQIAYGSDGVLYCIAPITEGGSHSLTYNLDPTDGTLTQIDDDVIIIDDPFSDISKGPIM